MLKIIKIIFFPVIILFLLLTYLVYRFFLFILYLKHKKDYGKKAAQEWYKRRKIYEFIKPKSIKIKKRSKKRGHRIEFEKVERKLTFWFWLERFS